MIYEKNRMCNDSFRLEKESEIWVYGYGKKGIGLAQSLKRSGYKVKGFIDRDAGSYAIARSIICTLPQFLKEYRNENCIVILSLQNANQQEMVARQLFEGGQDKIIYLPMRGGRDLSKRSLRRRIYKKVFDGKFELVKDIPVYCKNDSKDIFLSGNPAVVAAMSTDKVIFWCPVSKLRTATMDMLGLSDKKDLTDREKLLCRYSDVSLKEAEPYHNLFRWLKGDKSSDVMLYCKFSGRETSDECRVLLEDRVNLFQTYGLAYKYEMSFFIDSASTCQWNAKGYFNVIDGLHRIFYLMFMGRDEVPIEIRIEDWNKYIIC